MLPLKVHWQSLRQIEKYEKDDETMKLGLSKTHYPFDFFFERACQERQADKDAAVAATLESDIRSDSDDSDDNENDIADVSEPDNQDSPPSHPLDERQELEHWCVSYLGTVSVKVVQLFVVWFHHLICEGTICNIGFVWAAAVLMFA